MNMNQTKRLKKAFFKVNFYKWETESKNKWENYFDLPHFWPKKAEKWNSNKTRLKMIKNFSNKTLIIF